MVAWKWVKLSEQGDKNEEMNAGYVVNGDETLSTDSDWKNLIKMMTWSSTVAV